jgi:hypothetical protein
MLNSAGGVQRAEARRRTQEIVSVEELEFELKSAHSCMDPKDT